MSTNRILQIKSEGSEQTERIAQKLAANLRGGLVLELTSDLGGGKTTFVRGLVKGLNSADHVSSPTFKLSNVYNVASNSKPEWNDVKRLYHYDFYRLPDAGLMGHELHDALGDPNGVVVVEWGKVVAKVLPKDRISIRLVVTGNESRFVIIDCPPGLEYVIAGLE